MSESSDAPRSADDSGLLKVAFDLEPERSGWPPVSVERLWGEKTDVRMEIRLVNTPFFARGIAFGDLVRVRPDHERRELVFEEFTAESGHSAIRIVFIGDAERPAVEARLCEAGCSWESAGQFGSLVAVDIPPTVDYGELRSWLVGKVDAGSVEIQESALSQVHRRQLAS
ncbi:DUF4265 domain-containing protein [Amycolatopsis vastitatis]|nr:DUF4265 domain-containing protein [Amycolatopsis vastitatis]